MRSSSTITWVIYKRYNDFFELHQQVALRARAHVWPQLPTLLCARAQLSKMKVAGKPVVLPNIPPKKCESARAAPPRAQRLARTPLTDDARGARRLTRSLAQEFVEKRKQELQGHTERPLPPAPLRLSASAPPLSRVARCC